MEYFVVDVFADKLFAGNPAGVCIPDRHLSDDEMQSIAAENNLSETAFIYKTESGYNLRWFTPGFEMDLCGHATIGTAFIVDKFLDDSRKAFSFSTKSGILTVAKQDELYELAMPIRRAKPIETTDDFIEKLGVNPVAMLSDRDLYVVLKSEKEVENYEPDYEKLSSLNDWLGVVITARGSDCDFVSRYFCPELKLEDAVTGSSHSSLVPYWSEILGKDRLTAKQLSKRGGTLVCGMDNQNVFAAGKVVLYQKGEIKI